MEAAASPPSSCLSDESSSRTIKKAAAVAGPRATRRAAAHRGAGSRYRCSTCRKAFGSRQALGGHQKLHASERRLIMMREAAGGSSNAHHSQMPPPYPIISFPRPPVAPPPIREFECTNLHHDASWPRFSLPPTKHFFAQKAPLMIGSRAMQPLLDLNPTSPLPSFNRMANPRFGSMNRFVSALDVLSLHYPPNPVMKESAPVGGPNHHAVNNLVPPRGLNPKGKGLMLARDEDRTGDKREANLLDALLAPNQAGFEGDVAGDGVGNVDLDLSLRL